MGLNLNDTMTVQLTQLGPITIPKTLRDSYILNTGDVFTLLKFSEME